MSNYFGNQIHWRLETVDRGALVNDKIPEWQNRSMPDHLANIQNRVSSQNIQDNLNYGVTPIYSGSNPSTIGRESSFIIPLTIKVFPKSMVYINTDANGELNYYQDHTQGSIYCTDYDYGFPIPDSDPLAWEDGRRYIGGIFMDQSQNNPL